MKIRKLKSSPADFPNAEIYLGISTGLRTGLEKNALAAVIMLEKHRQNGMEDAYPDKRDVQDMAEKILTGHRPTIPDKRGSLHQARLIYGASQLAAELALERAAALQTARAHHEARRRESEIHAGVHKLALAHCAARRSAKELLGLIREIKGKASWVTLPCEGRVPMLAGGAFRGEDVRGLLREALRAGIVTQAEIAREMSESEKVIRDEFGI